MKKQKKIIILLVAIIAIIFTAQGIIAYLTDTKTVDNVFVIGSVSIKLEEPNWEETNGINITPGKVIKKDPTIINDGKNSAYVYIKVEVPKVTLNSGSKGALFTYAVNNEWEEITSKTESKEDSIVKVYYYKTALDSQEVTTPLFDTVSVADYDVSIDNTQTIRVTGYAIQSENLPSGSDINLAYTNNF